ncbi:hypothetical protein HCC18_13055 [Listeria booriae]|uniref:hypothetical protein n=1 Tax=Listeria booriae TaxID=1552123 RepID=UPI0016273ADE|nr:hypothetical protein [Listeria booriae]MBC2317768.1 hypothetical protein [Listeria booriae]
MNVELAFYQGLFILLYESGEIKWPKADGFVVDNTGKAITFDAKLKAGQVIDGHGDPYGKFTSPVENGKILEL